jgi:GPH family glycoside/pentoside/hexuronide:cation symporter
VARCLDKRRAFILGSATWIAVLLGIFSLNPNQLLMAYLLAALAGSGIATAYVIPWSMVPDIIEHDELRTGQRREGSYYAFASFSQKLATGAAIWAMGQVLAYTGYITPTAGTPVPEQPPQALLAIRTFMGPVPVVLLILAILFAWGYPISRERHRALRDELAARDT